MSTRFQIVTILIFLLALSCEKGEVAVPGGVGGRIVLDPVFAVGSRVTTDAAFACAWEKGDAIGVFAVKHAPGVAGTLLSTGNYIHNARLVHDGTGWAFDGGVDFRWPDDGEVLDFHAYYPYSAGVTNPLAVEFRVATDQGATRGTGDGARSGFSESDFLVAKASNGGSGYGSGTTTVELAFEHALSMVQVEVSFPGGIAGAGGVTSVTLSGCRARCSLSLSDGVATGSGVAASVEMHGVPPVAGDTALVFRAMVAPGRVAGGERLYVVKHEGRHFPVAAASGGVTLEAGKVARFGSMPKIKPGIYTSSDLVQFSLEWNRAVDAVWREKVIEKWSGNPSGVVYLHADIDMSGVSGFTPIGRDPSSVFTGTFDGQGYAIRNLTVVPQGDYAGLFGYSRGSIRNVRLEDGRVTGKGLVGGISGCVGDGGTITGCSVSGVTVTAGQQDKAGGISGQVYSNTMVRDCRVTGGTVTGVNLIGGIVGEAIGGTIAGCSVDGVTVTARSNYAGGINGYSGSGTIEGCVVTGGTVTAANSAGGIVGHGRLNLFVSGCIVTGGVITATINNAGGICGSVGTDGTFTSCIAAPVEMNSQGRKGTCVGDAGPGTRIVACYGVNMDGTSTGGCTLFERDAVSGDATNFFVVVEEVTGKTPIETMNEMLAGIDGLDVRWTSGDAGSGWYPVPRKR